MTAGLELLAARQWLYATLAADTLLAAVVAGRIYTEQAPEDATFPLVLLTELSPGDDLRVVGTGRIWADPLFLVRGVAQTASFGGTLVTIAGRIETALNGKAGTATNGRVWSCVRERPFSLAETVTPGGTQYRHLGGVYRVCVA